MLTVWILYFHAITGLPHTHALCMTQDVHGTLCKNAPRTFLRPRQFPPSRGVGHFPLPSPSSAKSDLPLTCTKLVAAVDRLGSGVWISGSWFNSRGNVLGGGENCPDRGNVRGICLRGRKSYSPRLSEPVLPAEYETMDTYLHHLV